MANLVSLEKISLKNHPEIKEDNIQAYIFEHPESLDLGDLTALKREKSQPGGGRLDILLSDGDTHYETEIQLGATDPSHIIRTIEYWDLERKRNPQFNHCAVIIAEEITGRFMNVISLFNGAIPLIAFQMTAYKTGNDISLTFTKVLDRIVYENEETEEYGVWDRAYWDKRSSPKMMQNVEEVFNEIEKFAPGYKLKYNKLYIGLTKDGVVKNFVTFRPKKNFMHITFKGDSTAIQDVLDELEAAGLDNKYDNRWKEFYVRLDSTKDYIKHKELLDKLITASMQYFNISEG